MNSYLAALGAILGVSVVLRLLEATGLRRGFKFWPELRGTAESAAVGLEALTLLGLATLYSRNDDKNLELHEDLAGSVSVQDLSVWIVKAETIFAGILQVVSLATGRKACGISLRVNSFYLAWAMQAGWWVWAVEMALLMAMIMFGEGSTSKMFEIPPCADLPPLTRNVPKGEKGRVVIMTMGSRGDVQPFIALGRALESTGRADVVIATMAKFRDLVERHGLQAADCGMVDLELHRPIWRTAKHISELADVAQGRILDQYPTVAKGFMNACKNCDMIIAMGVTSGFGLTLAEYYGVPCWVVALAPEQPTRAFSPPNTPTSTVGLLNIVRWYWHWGRLGLAARRGLRGRGNPEQDFRTQTLGLKPLGGGKRIRQVRSIPKICAFSPTLVPKPADWPLNCTITGSWFLDGDEKAPAACSSRSLVSQDSLSSLADTKTVEVFDVFVTKKHRYVGCINFGSMTKAARELGILDAILKSFASEDFGLVVVDPDVPEDTQEMPSLNALILREIPHELLFPKCHIVVHHGGAGTSARVVESGCPALVVPIMLWTDQPLWADRLEAQGVARHVSREILAHEGEEVFIEKVTAAIAQLLSNSTTTAVKEAASNLREEAKQALTKSAGLILSSFTS